jgi:hypothetical protein
LKGLSNVIDDVAAKTTEQVASDLSKVVEENRRQKWQFSDGMNEARGQVAQECSERGLDYPSFDQVWEICAPRMVQAWASRAGLLGECKRAEIEGLLMRHTIRAGIAATLALWYTREFPILGPAPEFEPSDSRDIQHVLSAAAADAQLFVCQEKRLHRAMGLIQAHLSHLRVTDLDGLIAEVGSD